AHHEVGINEERLRKAARLQRAVEIEALQRNPLAGARVEAQQVAHLSVLCLARRHAAVSRSISTSACRLSISRKIVARAMRLPLRRNETAQSRCCGSPSSRASSQPAPCPTYEITSS